MSGTQKVVPLLKDTYLAVIKNSVGSNAFRNIYAEVGGVKKDIVENGNLSCAIFVSSVLVMFKLIKEIHTTVSGTIRDLKESGWVGVAEPQIGCILVWKETDSHKHIGFYSGDGKAISNNYLTGQPVEHDSNFREIESILWNPKLA